MTSQAPSASGWRGRRPRLWILIVLGLVVCVAVAAAIVLLTRSREHLQVRIYDPSGQVKDEVTMGDIVPSSVEVSGAFENWALSFRFTPDGARKLHLLTRALAERGAQAQSPQAFAFAVDGHVYARPTVDYRNSPDGLSGSSGLDVLGLRCNVAQRLAVEMRGALFTPEQTGCIATARPKTAARAPARAVAGGGSHTCALLTSGKVECWGNNHFGELGDGTTGGAFTPNPTPTTVVGVAGVQAIAAGSDHTCALMSAGTVKCWGLNQYGQLGDRGHVDHNVPVAAAGLAQIRAVTAGDGQTCAVTGAGRVRCWGLNTEGQLGDGTTVSRASPVGVRGLGGVRTVDAGGVHTCALTSAGGVMCWGYNQFGQLGDGSRHDRHVPVGVSGLSSGIRMIAAGGLHTCALTNHGTVECWGQNAQGQLGDGTTRARLTPVTVKGLGGAVAIAAGDSYTCALIAAGKVECWGWNANGQLGRGTTKTSLTPVAVPGLSGVTAIAAGASHVCAVMKGGGLRCWGANRYGQLGDGTIHDRHRAVVVADIGPKRR